MSDNDTPPKSISRYIEYLPAIYRQEPGPGVAASLGRMLLAFEQVLTGIGDPDDPGVEETINGIVEPVGQQLLLAGLQRYFDPGPSLLPTERAPAEFLEWLGGWLGLTLRGDIDELPQSDVAKRDLIARAASLYQERGTKNGLEEIIGIYTRLGATISEMSESLQIDVHSAVGVDTVLDGGSPHFFKVLIRVATSNPQEIRALQKLVTNIIETEKPAHTYYRLVVNIPAFQIFVHSTLGVDTLLGSS